MGDIDIFASGSSLPDFENTDRDFELLQFSYIGEHWEKIGDKIDRLELITRIVQEFCPHEVKDSDP